MDELIVFQSLSEDELRQIVELLLKDFFKRVEENGYEMRISDAAKAIIMKEGFEPAYGARPLKRALQRLIEDAVSEEILKKTVQPGDTILIDGQDGQIVVKKKIVQPGDTMIDGQDGQMAVKEL